MKNNVQSLSLSKYIFIALAFFIAPGWISAQQNCDAGFTFAKAPNTLLTLNFSSKLTSTDFNYKWTFGDGGVSDSKTPSHIYLKAGKYKVCLTVSKKDKSCSLEHCDSIVVGEIPKPVHCDAGFKWAAGNSLLAFSFYSVANSDDFKYAWTFGDGGTSDSKNPGHSYLKPGKYRVCLVITKKDNSCKSDHCDSIVVGELPKPIPCNAGFKWGSAANSLLAINFYSAANSDDFKYAWTFGDGGSSDAKSPLHSYLKPGKYKVCLVITKKDNSCKADFCDSISIGGVVKPNTGCEAGFKYATVSGRKIQFTNSSGGAYNKVKWTFGDSHGSDVINPTHEYTVNGTYTVCLFTYRIEKNDTLCQSHKCMQVTINQDNQKACAAKFEFKVNSALKRIEFINQSVGLDLTYLWNFGDNSESHDKNPTHSYDHSGKAYKVCLTIKSSSNNLCYNQYCIEIPTDSLFQLPMSGINDALGSDLIKVYPNPFRDILNIQNEFPVEVHVYSLEGKEVFTASIGILGSVDLYEVPSGIYLIKLIDSQNRSYYSKIFKSVE